MKLAVFANAVIIAIGGSRADAAPASPCYAQTKDWHAWVERSPGGDRRELVVSGTVTTPTGLNRRYLTLGRVHGHTSLDQDINLEIKAMADFVTLAVETHEVRGRFAALPRYGSVIIRCNGQVVGRVSPVHETP